MTAPPQSSAPSVNWRCVLELDAERTIVAGGNDDLLQAVKRGADLRVVTAFRHNEHIDVTSSNAELIRESMDFRITYVVDGRWVAGILNLRQPISLPDGFGDPSMSFFLYNQDGRQAVARPYLDGRDRPPPSGPARAIAPDGMPRYHAETAYDAETNAPSTNFVYDFDSYQFWVCDSWQEVFANDAAGQPTLGCVADLVDAFRSGADVKVAVTGLPGDRSESNPMSAETFVHAGSCYYYTEQRRFITGTQPLVRVTPAIPLRYRSGAWDFGWLMLRSDGLAVYHRCDPYSLHFEDARIQTATRWFVR